MNIKKRPSTMVMSVRCDIRDVAVIALWLNDSGSIPDSLGTLGRTAIEMLADMVRAKNPSYRGLTTADALSRISQMGLQRGQRNTHTLVKRLELEDAVLEHQKPSYLVMPDNDLGDLADEVANRLKTDTSSKEEMDRITKNLGGAIYGGEDSKDGNGN